MEEIVYQYENGIYVNLTNRCPCRCSFCIRGQMDGLGTAESLWLEHTPTVEEVMKAFEAFPLKAGSCILRLWRAALCFRCFSRNSQTIKIPRSTVKNQYQWLRGSDQRKTNDPGFERLN